MSGALYPGSFDPPTRGHLDVALRAARLFPGLTLAVVANPAKAALFTPEERADLFKRALAEAGVDLPVAVCTGLLADFARARGVTVLVKGVRDAADLPGELAMAALNASLCVGLETVYLPANQTLRHVSSRAVKEIAALGGDVRAFAPDCVAQAVYCKFGIKQP